MAAGEVFAAGVPSDMCTLIFCVLVWYGTIAVFDFPLLLLFPEIAFGILLWRASQTPPAGAGRPGGAADGYLV